MPPAPRAWPWWAWPPHRAWGAWPRSGTSAPSVGVASAPPAPSRCTAVTTWAGNAPRGAGSCSEPLPLHRATPLLLQATPTPLQATPLRLNSIIFVPSVGWASWPRGRWGLIAASTGGAAAAAAPPPPRPLPAAKPRPLPLNKPRPSPAHPAPPLSGARSARGPSGWWRSCTSITCCTPGGSSEDTPLFPSWTRPPRRDTPPLGRWKAVGEGRGGCDVVGGGVVNRM